LNLKSRLLSGIRALGGAPFIDYCHYLVVRILKSPANRRFKVQYQDIPLPPTYLVYESFQMDYRRYYLGGQETAKWIKELVSPYILTENLHILDWGCGPARVIRHLPTLFGASHAYYGCDYNPATIAWCQENIKQVSFSLNDISPPLPYDNRFFDVVYGISIFTHLSEESHLLWSRELQRILSPNGILLLTTHGEAFKEKLTPEECRTFDAGKLVIRSKAKEGQRMFGAFHPPSYLRALFGNSGLEILKHIGGKKQAHYIEQDTWILKKISNSHVA